MSPDSNKNDNNIELQTVNELPTKTKFKPIPNIKNTDPELVFKPHPLNIAGQKYLDNHKRSGFRFFSGSISSPFSMYHTRQPMAKQMKTLQSSINQSTFSDEIKRELETYEALKLMEKLDVNSGMFKYLYQSLQHNCQQNWNMVTHGAVATMYDNPITRVYNRIQRKASDQLKSLDKETIMEQLESLESNKSSTRATAISR